MPVRKGSRLEHKGSCGDMGKGVFPAGRAGLLLTEQSRSREVMLQPSYKLGNWVFENHFQY